MDGEWIETTIGDQFEIKHGFAYKGEHFRDGGEGDVLVTPGNFRIGGGFTDQSLKRYVGPEVRGYALPAGEIVVTMTDLSKAGDTLGYAAKIPSDGRRYLHNQRIGRLVPRVGSKVTPDFAYWVMRTAEYRHHVLGAATGSTVKHTAPSRIQSYRFCRPPLPVQQQVTKLLGALDDKIELNQRMAETLVATARALFKSWFVEFDHTRTKAEGCPDALLDTFAALFPESFGADGLPAGWSLSTVGDLFDVIGGNTPSTAAPENWDGPHQWATPKDLSGIAYSVLLQTDRKITDVGLARSTSGLLPAGSLLLSSRAPIGYMAFASKPVAINQGFAGFVRREVGTAYAWCWCSENMELIRGNAGGSTFPEISKTVLRGLPMLRPTDAVLAAFDEAVGPVVTRLVAAAEQSATLAALRDTLLPRLISGELRIRDAERAIAAA